MIHDDDRNRPDILRIEDFLRKGAGATIHQGDGVGREADQGAAALGRVRAATGVNVLELAAKEPELMGEWKP